MDDQKKHTQTLRQLHVSGTPLVLHNIWDAGTARIVAEAGAAVIATGSWAVAAAHGLGDGEGLPLAVVLASFARIVNAVDLPVTVDLEAGYGAAPDMVGDTVSRAVALGVAGFNLEDQVIGEARLFSATEQAARIAAARHAADANGARPFLNARTDVFMSAGGAPEIATGLAEVLTRAAIYQDAGADGLFVPGLVDAPTIGALCQASPLPVNIMLVPGSPEPEVLAGLGVSRISCGPGPYIDTMAAFGEQAKAVYA